MCKNKKRCHECMFRGDGFDLVGCDYATITGHVRGAIPPEQCTHFRKGERMKRAEYMLLQNALRKKPKRAPGGGRKEEHDWELARKLYNEGYNDGQIARVMKLRPQHVCQWRKRNNLPANDTVGGRRHVKDWDLVRELYEKGMNDREIADEVNVTDNVIYKWRKRNNLPPNAPNGRQRKKRDET